MRISTPFTELLGIDLPIVQAPIGGCSTPELVAAVGDAGGLGMLSTTWRTLDELPKLLTRTRALTARPYGVNFVLEWDPAERLRICLEHGARVVSFFWGDPEPWIGQVHAAGALVAQTVGSAAEAARAKAIGADILVAQGWEAGGHVWGETATMALVPRVVDAAGGAPVIAAGGIADGRGLAAVLALGAAGVWMGTRFVATDESAAHAEYRSRLVAAVESATVHTKLFDVGWPNASLRALRNSTHERWREAGEPASGSRPGEGGTVAVGEGGEEIPRYHNSPPMPGMTGDLEALVHYAGQGVGLIDDVRPAGDVVREIAADALDVMARLGRLAG
ncbi:MAG: NAD(P)H-dependent flavin oxidoreductase [Thermomicrobiales bacterium]